MPSSVAVYISIYLLYFTFTEFPEWYGGEIIHDPIYSAIAAIAASSPGATYTTASSISKPGTHITGAPGFEIMFILGTMVLVIRYRFKRRRKK
jgi:hypothetical protein